MTGLDAAGSEHRECKIVSGNRLPQISDKAPPGDVLDWALRRFAGWAMVATTQFGMEGCALIDMLARRTERFTVIYLDTHFLFSETYELRDRLAKRYPNITIENRGTDLTPDQQVTEYGDQLWVRNPDQCCQLRKVEPMTGALRGVDVWITGLRRSQSAARGSIVPVAWDWKYQLLKVNPLAGWERKDVWEYIQQHEVPYNPLHERGYPSIGCTHCTVPVSGIGVDGYSRDGRWPGTTKNACGLHGDGI